MSGGLEPSWGLLPDYVYKVVLKREWSSISVIKNRLSGKKAFPIKIGLKPPSGKNALANYSHLEEFIKQWLDFEHQELLMREIRNFRNVGQQQVPTFLVIDSIKALAKYLGKEAQEKLVQWESKILPIMELDNALVSACIGHLEVIDTMAQTECVAMAKLIPQLRPKMGQGLYLRALPVTLVHTKFIETYDSFITSCLDVLTDNEVSNSGGLMSWLECTPKPIGWILVRPLCPKTKKSLGNIPILKMSQRDLSHFNFPCKNIIVVENESTGLSLPEMAETIAVFGGGANVSWLSSEYLSNKHVYYWGDFDSYGFKFLNDARQLCPHLKSIMMDESTLMVFESYMSDDNFHEGELPELTSEEFLVYDSLRNNKYANTRLEQEYISQDFIENFFRKVMSKSSR